jgi:MFS family permease
LENNPADRASPGRGFVSSLTLAFSSTYVIEFITGLFLLDITMVFFGSSEPVSVAIASQLVTISSIVTVIAGLLMGILSVRFSRKALLIIGILCVTAGVLGCFFAPNFIFMQIFYPIEGIGTIVVSAMSFALIGEVLVVSKRAKATGWIIAGAPMTGIAGTLVTWFFFTDVGSWRYFLLWFALPISLVAFASAYFGVPSYSHKTSITIGREAYLSSFKQVFLKKSSAGCLIGNMIRHAGLAWGIFGITFFRTQFGLSLGSAALLALGGAVVNVLASITGG